MTIRTITNKLAGCCFTYGKFKDVKGREKKGNRIDRKPKIIKY